MKIKNKKHIGFFRSLVLSFSISMTLFVFECFFFWMQGLWHKFPRPYEAFFETLGFVLVITLAFSSKALLRALYFVLLLTLLQWFHLSYFGTFLHPNAIYLFLINLGEVFQTAQSYLSRVALPSFFILLQCFIFWKKLKLNSYEQGRLPWLRYLLVFALFYAPIRTAVTGHTYGKQPVVRKMSFSNTFASFSYFFGKILPAKANRKTEVAHLDNLQIRLKNPARHVILVMGESLRYQNLSLFGYSRPTTPSLDSLAKQNQILFRKAFSGGVSTDVSLPLFFNASQGQGSFPVIISQKRCLFSLAELNGFETHLISAQTETSLQHIVNYVCPTSISDLQIGTEELTGSDQSLVEAIKKMDLTKPQFIVLHQRGSHSPYNIRYPEAHLVFKIEPGDSYDVTQIKHYDNSVHFTDDILRQVLNHLKENSKLPFDFVFTSDHGESLGENGTWGHVMLGDLIHRVPFLFYSSDQDSFYQEILAWPEYTNHQEISQLMIRLLGFEIPAAEKVGFRFYVMGPDLDGLDGGWMFDFTKAPPIRVAEPTH